MALAIPITMTLSPAEAEGLAQLVKRLERRSLRQDDLNLVQADEQGDVEAALIQLRLALAQAGFEPR